MKAVTYGPFPGGWPASFEQDFLRMVESGFNAIRFYEMPETNLLDAAQRHGLKVFGGLKWGQNADFMMRPGLYSAARVALANSLKDIGSHPALAGVHVAPPFFFPPSGLRHLLRRGYKGQEGFYRQAGLAQRQFREPPAKSKFLAMASSHATKALRPRPSCADSNARSTRSIANQSGPLPFG